MVWQAVGLPGSQIVTLVKRVLTVLAGPASITRSCVLLIAIGGTGVGAVATGVADAGDVPPPPQAVCNKHSNKIRRMDRFIAGRFLGQWPGVRGMLLQLIDCDSGG